MRSIYKNKKQSFFIVVLVSFLLIVICLLRFSSSEDYWTCSNNTWVKHGQPRSPLPTSICSPSSSKSFTPSQIIENFYNWYFHIDNNLLSSAYYKDSDFLTSNFKNSASIKTNPFLCNHAENPISFSAQEIYSNNNKSLVMMYQSFLSKQDRLEVSLVKKQGYWYIDKINCAKSFDSIQQSAP